MTKKYHGFGVVVLVCALLVGCGRSSVAANESNAQGGDDDADAAVGQGDDVSGVDAAKHADTGGHADETTGTDATADAADAGDIGAKTKTDAWVVDVATKPPLDAGADADAASEVSTDTGGPIDAGDTGLPTAEPASATCKDKRHRNDNKQKGDYCWAPPQHYCSPGEGAMLWFGCAPDQSACCLFDSWCRPCGWTKCPFVPKGAPPPSTLPPGCPTYFVLDKPSATVPLECQPYIPNDTEFCWDNAPEEWKTYDFHIHDDL